MDDKKDTEQQHLSIFVNLCKAFGTLSHDPLVYGYTTTPRAYLANSF